MRDLRLSLLFLLGVAANLLGIQSLAKASDGALEFIDLAAVGLLGITRLGIDCDRPALSACDP